MAQDENGKMERQVVRVEEHCLTNYPSLFPHEINTEARAYMCVVYLGSKNKELESAKPIKRLLYMYGLSGWSGMKRGNRLNHQHLKKCMGVSFKSTWF